MDPFIAQAQVTYQGGIVPLPQQLESGQSLVRLKVKVAPNYNLTLPEAITSTETDIEGRRVRLGGK